MSRLIPLIKARLKANLTQQQVSDVAGIDRRQLGILENGKFKIAPRNKTVFGLARAFKKKPEEIFAWFDKHK